LDEKKLAGLMLQRKRAIVEKEDDTGLSVRRQCELLELNRSGLYYTPEPMDENDVRLMNVIDEEFTEKPCLGSRQMVWRLFDRGYQVGRKRVRRLMRLMGLRAVFPTRNTSQPNPENKVYPYLLRGVAITKVNQVWSMDITYIRLGKGFVYLVAVVDWYSRYVVSWRLSNTLTADFCVDCVKDALQYGKPAILNTDQGCQFTSDEFTRVLVNNGITISMDGRGRALDNIFVERLWRTVKYEDVYLKGYQTIPEAQAGLSEYFDYYNMDRRHSSLSHKTPWSIFSGLEMIGTKAAASQKI
jgi:putative transposase